MHAWIRNNKCVYGCVCGFKVFGLPTLFPTLYRLIGICDDSYFNIGLILGSVLCSPKMAKKNSTSNSNTKNKKFPKINSFILTGSAVTKMQIYLQ